MSIFPKVSGPDIRVGIPVTFDVAFGQRCMVSPFKVVVVGAGAAGIVAAAARAAVSFAFTSKRP